jgi:hypothetical protein
MPNKKPTGASAPKLAADLPSSMPLLPKSAGLITEINRVQMDLCTTAAKVAWLGAAALHSEAQRAKSRQIMLFADLRRTLAELIFSWPLAMIPALPQAFAGDKVAGRIAFGNRRPYSGAERRARAVVISFPDRRLA